MDYFLYLIFALLKGAVCGFVFIYIFYQVMLFLPIYVFKNKLQEAQIDFERYARSPNRMRIDDEAASLAESIMEQMCSQMSLSRKEIRTHVKRTAAIFTRLYVVAQYKEEELLERAFAIVRHYFYMTYGTYVDPTRNSNRNDIEFRIVTRVGTKYNKVKLEGSKFTMEFEDQVIEADWLPKHLRPEYEYEMAHIEIKFSLLCSLTSKNYNYQKY